jgi:dATP pyrophosphohydrolase
MSGDEAGRLTTRESIERWIVTPEDDGGRRVLLMRTAPSAVGTWPQFWQAITGGMEEGETPPDACRREVREETGIEIAADRIASLSLTLEIPVPEAGWLVRKRVFLAEAPEQPTAVSPEHVDARWVPMAEVEAMLHWDTCRTALARVRQELGLAS